jgi:hypothetical protein
MQFFTENWYSSPYTPQHLRSYYFNAAVIYSLTSIKVITCQIQPYKPLLT